VSGTYTRASQIVQEALVQTDGDYVRASQIAIESLSGALGYVRASQVVSETLFSALGFLRASQVTREALQASIGYVRTSQIVYEALSGTLGFVRCSQIVLEALVVNKELTLPSVFPTLPGLTFSVTKRPIGNFGVAEATSGGEVRINYWENPLWEWDLTYDYLPDFAGTGGISPSDLKAMMGFYVSTGCGFSAFCYTDPDDHVVLGQPLGTGDGTTTNFNLVRTFGLPAYGTSTDNIGYVNTGGPVLNGHGTFNLYVNGVLKTQGTDYTIINTTPMAQYVVLTSAPPAGEEVTVDMTYYYWVRFLDPKYDFEKFMNQLWSLKKITLHSLRY